VEMADVTQAGGSPASLSGEQVLVKLAESCFGDWEDEPPVDVGAAKPPLAPATPRAASAAEAATLNSSRGDTSVQADLDDTLVHPQLELWLRRPRQSNAGQPANDMVELVGQAMLGSFLDAWISRGWLLQLAGATDGQPRYFRLQHNLSEVEPITLRLEVLSILVQVQEFEDAGGCAAHEILELPTSGAAGGSALLSIALHVFQMFAWWRAAGPTEEEWQSTRATLRDLVLPRMLEALQHLASEEVVEELTQTAARGEDYVDDMDPTLLGSVLSAMSQADVVAAMQTWFGTPPRDATTAAAADAAAAAGHAGGAECRAAAVDLFTVLMMRAPGAEVPAAAGPQMMRQASSRAATGDDEEWLQRTARKIGECWDSAMSMSRAELEVLPAIVCLNAKRRREEKQFRALGQLTAAGTAAAGEHLMGAVAADARATDPAQAVLLKRFGLGSACDPLGQLPPPGFPVFDSSEGDGGASLPASSGAGGGGVESSSRSLMLSNMIQVQLNDVRHNTFHSSGGGSGSLLALKLVGRGRGTLDALGGWLQAEDSANLGGVHSRDNEKQKQEVVWGPLAALAQSASPAQLMQLLEACATVASCTGLGLGLQEALEDDTAATADGVARHFMATSAQNVASGMAFEVAEEGRAVTATAASTNLAMYLRVLHAVLATGWWREEDDGALAAAVAADERTWDAMVQSLTAVAEGIEAQGSLPTHATQAFACLAARANYGANPALHGAGPAEAAANLRWLAATRARLSAALRAFGWLFGDGARPLEWTLEVTGDFSQLAGGQGELLRLVLKYIGSVPSGDPALAAAAHARDAGAALRVGRSLLFPGLAQRQMLSNELAYLVCMKYITAAAQARALAAASFAQGSWAAVAPRHFCMHGGAAGKAHAVFSFLLPPDTSWAAADASPVMTQLAESFILKVVQAIAQNRLISVLRGDLAMVYSVSVFETRAGAGGGSKTLPGAVAVDFSCAYDARESVPPGGGGGGGGGGALRKLLHATVATLKDLQTAGPSHFELASAVHVQCEAMRVQQEDALGALMALALQRETAAAAEHAVGEARAAASGRAGKTAREAERLEAISKMPASELMGRWFMGNFGAGAVREMVKAVFSLDGFTCSLMLPGGATGGASGGGTGSAQQWSAQAWPHTVGDYTDGLLAAPAAPEPPPACQLQSNERGVMLRSRASIVAESQRLVDVDDA